MKYSRFSRFESDPTQPKQRVGTMEDRCKNCGHDFNDHYNGQCPQDEEDPDEQPKRLEAEADYNDEEQKQADRAGW